MVLICNELPQSLSGSIDTGSIICCRDTNDIGTYNMKDIEFDHKDLSLLPNNFMFSLQDYPTSTNPETVVYDENSNALYVMRYQNKKLSTSSLGIVDTIKKTRYETFAKIRNTYFAHFENNAKYIYSSNSSGILNKRTDAYATTDGKDTGTTNYHVRLFSVFDKYLIAIGGDLGGIRYYTFNEEQNQLTYKGEIDTNYKPSADSHGAYTQLNSSTIFGCGAYYYGNTGYPIYYKFQEQQDQLTATSVYQKLCDDKGNDLVYTSYERLPGTLSYWNNKVHIYATTYQATASWGICNYYTLNGISYIRHDESLPMGDNYLLSINQNTILGYDQKNKQIIQYTLGESGISQKILYTLSPQSTVWKIPGIPALYIDIDIFDLNNKPRIICSDCGGFPTIVPEGSIVNGETQTENQLQFYRSGINTITLTATPLTKKVYCFRNKDGGFCL